jgi:hypothetical protein
MGVTIIYYIKNTCFNNTRSLIDLYFICFDPILTKLFSNNIFLRLTRK